MSVAASSGAPSRTAITRAATRPLPSLSYQSVPLAVSYTTRSSASWPALAPGAAQKRGSSAPNAPALPVRKKTSLSSRMASVPEAKSVMRGASATLVPDSRQKTIESAPAPPVSVSPSATPSSVSLPAPPSTRSASPDTRRKSFPSSPSSVLVAPDPNSRSSPAPPWSTSWLPVPSPLTPSSVSFPSPPKSSSLPALLPLIKSFPPRPSSTAPASLQPLITLSSSLPVPCTRATDIRTRFSRSADNVQSRSI